MWILSKMRLWNCEFCQKQDFENVNFVKKQDFGNVNFMKNETLKLCIFAPVWEWDWPSCYQYKKCRLHKAKVEIGFSTEKNGSLTPLDGYRLIEYLENVHHHKQFWEVFRDRQGCLFGKFGIWYRQNKARNACNLSFVLLMRWRFCLWKLWFSLVIWKTCRSNAPFLKHSVWKLLKKVSFEFWSHILSAKNI